MYKTGLKMLKLAHSMEPLLIPISLLGAILEAGIAFVQMILSARLIDALLAGEFRHAGIFALLLVTISLGVGILTSLLKRKYRLLGSRCTGAFGIKLREKALSLDYATMEKPGIAEKIQYLETEMDMYGGLGSLVLAYENMLRGVLIMGASLAMVLQLCLKVPVTGGRVLQTLTHPFAAILLFLAMFGITGGLSALVTKKNGEKGEEITKNHVGVENKIGYLIQQVFGDCKTGKIIRIFHMEEMLLENYRREWAKAQEFFNKQGAIMTGQTVSITAINCAFTIFSYLLTAMKFLTGAITVGGFTQYIGALNQFGGGFQTFVESGGEIKVICGFMKEFLEFMDMTGEQESGSIPVEKRLDGEYEFAFEDVSFHYPGNEEMILKHINCKLTMKDKMAVVGRNGAGKTTFIKLLCRLYEPTEGRITLNGVDIRKYDIEEYRDLFGVVFQDFKLFSFSVAENIMAGFDKDEERLKKCIRQAGAEDAVRNLPKGVDTLLYKNLGEGVEISGGEAQKIALSRALYKDAPVVVLDEPTAALDPLGEAEVYAGFDEMVKEKTSIYISHRMSSCRFCNDIIVFDEGRIVERGSHETLLAENGQYSRLWNAQAQYYAS